MKKFCILVLSIIVLGLSSCSSLSDNSITYSDNETIYLEMKHDSLKVLQLTDLHLTYGIDAYDRATFKLIERLVKSDDFDLVVISGDISLSPLGPWLFHKLLTTMESLKIPWTFIFGNHETDYNSYQDYLTLIPDDIEYLQFKTGPDLEGGGVGNFVIEFQKDSMPFYQIVLMDSHAERDDYTEEEGIYDYLKTSQIDWYETKMTEAVVDNIVFMHIPIRQMMDTTGYIGIFNEDKVYAQGKDTGFFDSCVNYGRTKAMFFGHDHLNDFYVVQEGIILSYGRITGYSAYGNLERGGRVIEVLDNQNIVMSLVLESGVSE